MLMSFNVFLLFQNHLFMYLSYFRRVVRFILCVWYFLPPLVFLLTASSQWSLLKKGNPWTTSNYLTHPLPLDASFCHILEHIVPWFSLLQGHQLLAPYLSSSLWLCQSREWNFLPATEQVIRKVNWCLIFSNLWNFCISTHVLQGHLQRGHGMNSKSWCSSHYLVLQPLINYSPLWATMLLSTKRASTEGWISNHIMSPGVPWGSQRVKVGAGKIIGSLLL